MYALRRSSPPGRFDLEPECRTRRWRVPTTTPLEREPADEARDAAAARPASFPIVGIGASAGGLEACSQLLSHLPRSTGMAFLVAQHLDPHHESSLPSLLQRVSPLPVHQAEDGMELRPDHVYVISPNVEMTVSDGHLRVVPRPQKRGPHLAVDRLFHSLAETEGSRAIGIVLSGSGTDGMLGVTEIKAVGGITFAQEESTASQPGMPHAAVESGNVDFVLSPAEIAHRLADMARHPYLRGREDLSERSAEESFRRILGSLRAVKGVDFTHYRDTTIRRRILRRMALHRQEEIGAYASLVSADRSEAEALYQDLLINVTSFFRDPGLFEDLKTAVFPRIVEAKSVDDPIRMWVPGCSTGQGAYSIAIALSEFLDGRPVRPEIQIFASDLSDAPSLERARAGLYPKGI